MSDNTISGIASAIAAALIEKRLREGGTVTIPSLGIVLTAADLKDAPDDPPPTPAPPPKSA